MLASARTPQDISGKAIKDSFKESNFMVPVKDYNTADMEAAMKLSNMLKNPTEDQKVILDAIKALLSDTEKAKEGEKGINGNGELAQAEDSLLKAAASALLAQAMPDLIKKGDLSNIRAIFSELDASKNKIMLEYDKSTRPYYENMLKDLAKNMAILQLKNVLNSNMSKDQLEKLPPSELDKILEKIKRQKDRSTEEAYLLQQEAKYRKAYIDPSKQKLEDDMKGMIRSFTRKINDSLLSR